MNRCLWIVLLLPFSPLFAKDKKFGGYVIDPAAFRKVQSYCVDTHNLPPDQVNVIDHFVSQESKPQGLLTRLPWHRLATCQEGGPDAIVRIEFPHSLPSNFMIGDGIVRGVLLVFRAGSPTPIYETRAMPMYGWTTDNDGRHAVKFIEQAALDSVVRVLIHDWQKFSEIFRDAAS